MTLEPTHYEVLGVAPDADRETIRRAYVAIARSTHPDRAGLDPGARADAARTIRLANAAWNVLGDDTRRRAYDRRLGGVQDRPRPAGPPRTRIVTDWAGAPDEAPPTPATGWAWVGLVLFLLAVLAVVVVSAYASAGGPSTASSSSTVAKPEWVVGDCVDVSFSPAGRVATPRHCGLARSGRIVAVVDSPRPCPSGEAVVLADARTTLCLAPI